MSELDHLCPGCFLSGGGARPCKECGYAGEDGRPRNCLPALAVLQGSLVVGRLLGKPGSFGITYLGWDRILERKVAIKEYLPRELAGRDAGDPRVRSHSVEEEGAFSYGLEKFVEEARILAHFDHPNIVRVQRFFQENGTAYLVMDYHDGVSLDQHLGEDGRLPEGEAVALLLPIVDALSHIHAKGLVHRDVKPSNVYLKGGRTPILLDFGAARTALGERTKNLSVLLSPGYAPIEQYSTHGQLGPWTDVYAAAATLYRMLTGKGPADANSRYEEDKLEPPDQLVPDLSPRLSQVILEGLAIKRQDRPQSAEAFAGMLRMALEAPAVVAPEPAPPTVTPELPPSTGAPEQDPAVEPKAALSMPPPEQRPSMAALKPTSPTTTSKQRPSTPPVVVRQVSWLESFGSLVLQALSTFRSSFVLRRSKELHTRELNRPRTKKEWARRRKMAERPAKRRWVLGLTIGGGVILICAGIIFFLERPPLEAMPDQTDARTGEEVVLPVLDNDHTRRFWLHLRLESVGEPSHGTARLGPDNAVTYTPSPGFSGQDRFSYTVTDSWDSYSAEVLVTVGNLTAGEIRRNERDGLEYAWIPPGEFQMGCTEVDEPCEYREKLDHKVVISRGFWLSTTEVTVGAYRRLSGIERPFLWLMSSRQPMAGINWSAADAFCRWAGGRLPSEAEWEYAARGGKNQRYPWGNEKPVPQKGAPNGAAFAPELKGPAEVGSFGKNAFSLFDMAGNVHEWCQDTYHFSYFDAPSDGSAWISEDESLRMFRGGSWATPETDLRLASRGSNLAADQFTDVGFRCARDMPPLREPESE